MRLVICDGVQYDADELPPGVNAARCVPADEWFAKHKMVKARQAEQDTVAPVKRSRRRKDVGVLDVLAAGAAAVAIAGED